MEFDPTFEGYDCIMKKNGDNIIVIDQGKTTEYKVENTPILLFHCLSEHHWQAAEILMNNKKRKIQWCGEHCYPDENWFFYLERDDVNSKKVRRITAIKKNGVIKKCHTNFDTLLQPHRCNAYLDKTESSTGKWSSRKRRRCKNWCYSHFCHSHKGNYYLTNGGQ